MAPEARPKSNGLLILVSQLVMRLPVLVRRKRVRVFRLRGPTGSASGGHSRGHPEPGENHGLHQHPDDQQGNDPQEVHGFHLPRNSTLCSKTPVV